VEENENVISYALRKRNVKVLCQPPENHANQSCCNLNCIPLHRQQWRV
jgi:hypothetical protein